MKRFLAFAVLGMAAAGCGPDQNGSAQDVSPLPEAGPTLESLRIEAPLPSVEVGEALTLTCLGSYSDGSEAPVDDVTWQSSIPEAVTFSARTGSAVDVTGQGPASVTIMATHG